MNGTAKGECVDHLIEQLLSQQPQSKTYLERLMARNNGKGKAGAFAAVDGSCCSACNISIPTSQLQRVVSGEMINCSFCQRFLYMDAAKELQAAS
jgi:predicted  nucleic acid-binding Zn-ribbon protein